MAKEILIADSDKADQDEFKKIFEIAGYHLSFIEKGEDVLTRIRRSKPDLIIAGMNLSGKTGLDLCEIIKKDQNLRDIPFILLSNIFEEIAENDRKRVKADGILSRPLFEDEVLPLVENLIEERASGSSGKDIFSRKTDQPSFQELRTPRVAGEEEFLLDEPGEDEEQEIIDLIDIVEEPESRMSINDFVSHAKEDTYGEITPLESWNRLEEEKPEEAGKFEETSGKIFFDKEFELPPVEKEVPTEELDLQPEKESVEEAPESIEPEDELFQKIEIKDILARVERMQPSIEKEWPEDMKVKVPEKTVPPPKEKAASPKEAEEPFMGMREFEFALQGEVKPATAPETSPDIGLQPLPFEDLSAAEPPLPAETALEEESLPEEEIVGAEELEEETLPEEEIVGAEELEEESLEELSEEEFPEELLSEALKKEETVPFEELRETEPEEIVQSVEPPAEPLIEPPVEFPIESPIESYVQPPVEAPLPSGADIFDLFETKEEIKAEESVYKPSGIEGIRINQFADIEQIEPTQLFEEKIAPLFKTSDKHLEEIISKGIEEMVGEFITKILPDMTQNILGLTAERIEKMVKEIVPEMTEKAIREEIKKLQKGEKD